jgi:hypothetical protein
MKLNQQIAKENGWKHEEKIINFYLKQIKDNKTIKNMEIEYIKPKKEERNELSKTIKSEN